MSRVVLVIGNKNYSSWSLRGWLGMRKSGVAFEERWLPLDTPRFHEEIADLSPTRQVPVLWHDARCIWDSLAINEYANETFADGRLWPEDPYQRALARSVSAEMHSGFSALRKRMPMNCRAQGRIVEMDSALEAEIGRILSIWTQCREVASEEGGWLFGRFSIADSMFAPVALRFYSYSVNLPATAQQYVEHVRGDADVAAWMEAGCAEPEVIAAEEVGEDSPAK